MKSIRQQIEKSVVTTMRGPGLNERRLDDLTAYVESLQPPVSVHDARGETNVELIRAGQAVFERMNCADCHQAPTFTSPELYDVGLEDQSGRREFNPPSLRGFGHRGRFLHDGSAHTLREALQIHPEGKATVLSDDEWQALETYLQSL